jgi:putative transposase
MPLLAHAAFRGILIGPANDQQTMMGKVRLIPGQTYSKVLGEKPRHSERRACFTLRELELYLAREISMYHKRKHEGIGIPPLTAWERAWTVNGSPCAPRIPDCSETFRITFLPGTWRTVTREGIELNALRYQSADLYPFIERRKKFMVRWDPRDLSHIFVERRNSTFASRGWKRDDATH